MEQCCFVKVAQAVLVQGKLSLCRTKRISSKVWETVVGIYLNREQRVCRRLVETTNPTVAWRMKYHIYVCMLLYTLIPPYVATKWV